MKYLGPIALAVAIGWTAGFYLSFHRGRWIDIKPLHTSCYQAPDGTVDNCWGAALPNPQLTDSASRPRE